MAQRSMLSFLSKKPTEHGGEEGRKRKRREDDEPKLTVTMQAIAWDAGVQRKESGTLFGPNGQAHAQPGQKSSARGKEVEPDSPALFDGVGSGLKPAGESQENGGEVLHVYKKRPRSSKAGSDAGEDGAAAVGVVEGNAEIDEKERLRKRNRLLQSVGADDCAGPQQSAAWQEAAARFDWLDPGKIRDKQNRRPDHPDYDARTVRVPDSVMLRLSGTQKEYWKIKQDYMDIVLFFKVGSFYELYELDAEIGIKEFGWKLTLSGVGKCRQVGVPASGVDDACRKLVARGYKVGRVEQTETGAEAKAKRGPSAMVQRKLLKVESPALLVDEIRQPEAVHLLALRELELGDQGRAVEAGEREQVVIGFAFVDAAAGRFYVGEVRDDSSRSALGALLAQIAPQEIVHERHGLTAATRKLLKRAPIPGSLPLQLTPLDSGAEFLEPPAALAEIASKAYFGYSQAGTPSKTHESGSRGPLAEAHGGGDEQDPAGSSGLEERSSGTRIDPDAEALLSGNGPSVSALWALICHLRRLKVAAEMLPRGELSSYAVYRGSLRLDGQTLQNLELLQNAADGGRAGTLLANLDSCVTAQGKRLLRRWICHPSRSTAQIVSRQDGVEELVARPELARAVREELRKLPDLERLLGRVKAMASAPAAISYFAAQTHQKHVSTFCATLGGLQQACAALTSLHALPDSARVILKPFIRPEEVRLVSESFDELTSFFDWPKPGAKDRAPKLNLKRAEDSSSGKAAPETSAGKRASKKGKKAKAEDDEDPLGREVKALSRIVEVFADRRLATWGSLIGEALARVDVLVAFAAAAMAADGPTCRPVFVDKTAPDFAPHCAPASERGSAAGLGPSLATPSPSPRRTGAPPERDPSAGGDVSGRESIGDGLPEECQTPVSESGSERPNGGAVLQIEGLWHPYAIGGGGGTFVPNDLTLGGPNSGADLDTSQPRGTLSASPRGMLLTGPNMGGKSTLLRATCLAVIMAQLGCRVPAEKCSLSLVDTIFTRLGASDRIFSGESTFLVECSEAASVLRHATADSLVVLDELGRGTSTFDGYSIAYAVLKHLSEALDCRLLFATHYHPLTAEFASSPRITLAHMACQMLLDGAPSKTPRGDAETLADVSALSDRHVSLPEADDDNLQKEGQLVFLYKLRPGPCPKSYGLQVATLAGIPRSIVRAAAAAARVMESKLDRAFSGAGRRGLELPCRKESASEDGCFGRPSDSSGRLDSAEDGSAKEDAGCENLTGSELRIARTLLRQGLSGGIGSMLGSRADEESAHGSLVQTWQELQAQ
ncbi:putative MutS homolog 6-2 [Klebsormidium nitens]|uniref:DNA mismatch repair protein n=1 Tax=Klebsormidium nitens TaxID=105231 RepID=A0A1Y1I695_KLENI|nr:putative MutS homolog 6-2 [Klebsormidium nitens]|eukprot:GAQ86033.1 putative MutS homolog 6-2 [Klebsormidium nitens]